LKTVQAPLAAIESPFSKYLMGACIFSTPHSLALEAQKIL